jgi:hypothetical protein
MHRKKKPTLSRFFKYFNCKCAPSPAIHTQSSPSARAFMPTNTPQAPKNHVLTSSQNPLYYLLHLLPLRKPPSSRAPTPLPSPNTNLSLHALCTYLADHIPLVLTDVHAQNRNLHHITAPVASSMHGKNARCDIDEMHSAGAGSA